MRGRRAGHGGDLRAAVLTPTDPTLVEDGDEPVVRLVTWSGPWAPDDPDANFKADVAGYSLLEPLSTVKRMAANLGVPVGALVRYVLAKWAAGGSEALLEVGPSIVGRMREACEAAEREDTDAARREAYEQLRVMVSWLAVGLDDPETAYPTGGARRLDG